MKKQLGYSLILIGAILIFLKIIESLLLEEGSVPFLILIGFMSVMLGLFLITRHKIRKHQESVKNINTKKANLKTKTKKKQTKKKVKKN